MNISELIERLTYIRDDYGELLVLADGQEGGYDKADIPVVTRVWDSRGNFPSRGRFVHEKDAIGRVVVPAVVIRR